MKQNNIDISVICPCLNEEKFIEECIKSLLLQDVQTDSMEVIFVDGGSTDNTKKILQHYIDKYPQLRILDNPKHIAPTAMNIGINAAQGKYIVRIDAHALYPTNYISTLIHYLEELPDAQNVGCAWKTEPRSQSKKALAIAEVLSNKYGIGGASFRIGTDSIKEVDTVPFGCFRKKDFEKFGYYDERLTRNQDIELNNRIKLNGGKIYLIPDITCTYFARDTYKDLMRNNYANGKWNILTIHYTRLFSSLSIRHFVPLLFVLSIFLPLVLSPIYPLIAIISIISLTLYFCLFSALSIHLSITKGLSFLHLFAAFFLLHNSYGIGSIVGIFSLPFIDIHDRHSK